MELNLIHFICLLGTIVIVLGCSIYSARSVKSAEGYSLGGRSSGVPLIAGSIAGTVIGGGATVGTAQMAYSLGLTAWWFTLGSGIGFILMGLFYARPLRRSGLETIPQYLVLNYGKLAGPTASIIASIGLGLSAVASSLPGIQMLAAIFGISTGSSAALLTLLVISYVFFGGMKGAGVSGLMKLVIIWITLFVAGGTACMALSDMTNFAEVFPPFPWFSLFGRGFWSGIGNLFSLLVGIICTQSYIQAIFSSKDAKTAAVGAFAAALVVIPVGLPSIAIAMFMHAQHPGMLPILVLPSYLVQYQPAWLGGIGLAGLLLSIVGSIAGLALGIGTMVSKDICAELFAVKASGRLLWINRSTVLVVTVIASLLALVNLNSQVLIWNYLSMALRGAGVFLPLTLAIFAPGRLLPNWTVASMLLSTFASLLAAYLQVSMDPLFVGLAVSMLVILLSMVLRRGRGVRRLHGSGALCSILPSIKKIDAKKSTQN